MTTDGRSLARYKELLKEYDAIHRTGSEEGLDELSDQLTDLWYDLTTVEREEGRRYSVELHNSWLPIERYRQAVEILEGVLSGPAGPNDRTPPEVRERRRNYWRGRRDAAWAEMTERERKEIGLGR